MAQDFRLEWDHIGYTVEVKDKKQKAKVQKKILEDVSGFVNAGEMLAIMGPSGAGKTTLLDIIAARNITTGKITGNVFWNGEETQKGKLAKLIGYVKQEDLFLGTNTVKEALMFSALLRLPPDMPYKAKEEEVDAVIEELGLTKVKDSKIGNVVIRGISGGEKKRTSIGLELVKKAQLLFLDEPTTGLDSAIAYSVIRTLKKLTTGGKRGVICTIHQPQFKTLKQFDKLLLLSRGKVVFFGPTMQAIEHFATMDLVVPKFQNPADFFLDSIRVESQSSEKENCVTEERLEEMITAYHESSFYYPGRKKSSAPSKDLVPSTKVSAQASWLTQFRLISARSTKNTYKNPMVASVELSSWIIMMIIVLMIYWQIRDDQVGASDRVSAVFFGVLTSALTPLFAVVTYFPLERSVFNRERAGGYYHTSAYFAATALATIPLQIVGSAIFVISTYWAVGYKNDAESFFIHLFVIFTLAMLSDALGLAVSAVAPSFAAGNIFGISLLLLWMTFAGFFIHPDNIPVYFLPLEYTSFMKYATDTLMYQEFSGRTFECDAMPCPIPSVNITVNNAIVNMQDIPFTCNMPCQFTTGDDLIAFYGLEDTSIALNFIIMWVMYVIFRLLSYLALKFTTFGKT